MRSSIRHHPYIRKDIVSSRGDPLSLHLNDQCLNSGHLIRDHHINNNFNHNNISLSLFSRIDQDSKSVGRQLLLRVPEVLDQGRGVGHVGSHGEPHYQCDCLVERTRVHGSVRPTTVGDLGKAHRIHVVVNNCQEKNHSIVLETSGTVAD